MFSKYLKNKKTIFLGAVLLASALGTNYSAAGMEGDSDGSNQRRILGTGSVVQKTDCFMGEYMVITTYYFLWMQLGEPTTQHFPC